VGLELRDVPLEAVLVLLGHAQQHRMLQHIAYTTIRTRLPISKRPTSVYAQPNTKLAVKKVATGGGLTYTQRPSPGPRPRLASRLASWAERTRTGSSRSAKSHTKLAGEHKSHKKCQPRREYAQATAKRYLELHKRRASRRGLPSIDLGLKRGEVGQGGHGVKL
jgi:hypothetical protein